MAYLFEHKGRKYAPWVSNHGRIALWGVSSYGQKEYKGQFMLRVYALVVAPAGRRGERRYRLPAETMFVPANTPDIGQAELLDTLMLAVATRVGREYYEHHKKTLRQRIKEKDDGI